MEGEGFTGPGSWLTLRQHWGTTIGGFAFTLVAYAVSHDVTTAGMVGTVFALCEGLGTLPGGHLSDRIDRKKLMIVFGLISAATLCVMTLALVAKMMSAPFAIPVCHCTGTHFRCVFQCVQYHLASNRHRESAGASLFRE